MSCGIHQMAMSQEMFKISILDVSLKITNLRLQPHFPGANELNWFLSDSLSCPPVQSAWSATKMTKIKQLKARNHQQTEPRPNAPWWNAASAGKSSIRNVSRPSSQIWQQREMWTRICLTAGSVLSVWRTVNKDRRRWVLSVHCWCWNLLLQCLKLGQFGSVL